MANFYIISYDPSTTNSAGLHKIIENNPDITHWWHYIKTAYLVKTTNNLDGIHSAILREWPNNRYLIIKVNPEYRNGWLPPDAWAWFKKNAD
jgi:hypothetical protein